MLQDLNDVTFIYPVNPDFDSIIQGNSFVPFSDYVLDFLDELAKNLFANKAAKKYPDVITFAFWCRRSNMLKLKETYTDNSVRLGRGIVFHITPSNVPINFAYSLVAGLLGGNINIVRIPSKDFDQTGIVCQEIAKLLSKEKHKVLAEKIVLLKYDRQSKATEYFSSFCDVRVIWGGDNSISQIRESKIPARAFDVTFADRYSFCIINADKYVNEKNVDNIAKLFYNDTFLYDQNACSAPHLIVWLGVDENIKKSKEMFWSSLNKLVEEKYSLEALIAVDKLTAVYRQAIEYSDIRIVENENNFITRIELDSLKPNIDEYRCYGGYFCEYKAENINEVANIVNRKYQTLAYYGMTIDELKLFKINNQIIGLDRIVPIGSTASFSLTWDGYNLPMTLSRVCDIF